MLAHLKKNIGTQAPTPPARITQQQIPGNSPQDLHSAGIPLPRAPISHLSRFPHNWFPVKEKTLQPQDVALEAPPFPYFPISPLFFHSP